MKTVLRSLAGVALCIVGISCVGPYDDYYGYGGGYSGGYGGYAPVSYSSYYGRGYPSYYSPGYSSLSIGYYGGGGYPYGGYGYPYGYSSYPYRYSSYRTGYRGGDYGYNRYTSRSYPYASQYSRGSSFRGSTVTTTPGMPSFTPRTVTRPSSSTFRAPSSNRYTSPAPAPSGRVNRPVTTVSRTVPSVSTRSSATVTTSASTGNSRYHRTR